MSRRRGQLPTWEAAHGWRKGRCRECGKEVEPPRVSWCGDECVQTHKLRSDPGAQRLAVFARDHGICSACGRDCVALRKDLQPLVSFGANAVTIMAIVERGYGGSLPDWWRDRYGQERADKVEQAIKVALDLGLLAHVGGPRTSYWDMDHRTPLWNGGSNAIENLITLCVPCHRDKTAAEAARRASQRRKECEDKKTST